MELILLKQNGALIPDNEHDAEKLSHIKNGEWVQVKTKKQRNGQFHRKFFALLTLAFENQDKYENFEAFRAEVIMRAGEYIEHHHVSGQISYQPKSISFEKMDDISFRELYNKVVQVILDHFMVGADENTLMQVAGF